MVFSLKHITDYISKINDVPLVFFENVERSRQCDETIFPFWFRKVYRDCPGVKNRFETLYFDFKKLTKKKKRAIIDLYRQSKDLKRICGDDSIKFKGIDAIKDSIAKNIADSITDICIFLYNNTLNTDSFQIASGMSIKDHYEKFFDENEVHVCPFCGLESYVLPEHRRAEYDHYLPSSVYPWLAVNFNNLVPMGDICNGKKNDSNILYQDYRNDIRRLAWYPYEWISYTMEMVCVQKPTLANIKGSWAVKFSAGSKSDAAKITTWTEVFGIHTQYSAALRRFHRKFIEEFAHNRDIGGANLSIMRLRQELRSYLRRGIGDSKMHTMANLRETWVNYYLNTPDLSQLAVIIHAIAILPNRKKP